MRWFLRDITKGIGRTMTHKDLFHIANALLGGENLKTQKGAIARELKILQSLTKGGKYDALEFWDDLHLGFQLQSLCWFKTEEGRNVLENAWRLFQYERAERARANENLLDSAINADIVENASRVEVPEVPLPKKQNALDWADSPTFTNPNTAQKHLS